MTISFARFISLAKRFLPTTRVAGDFLQATLREHESERPTLALMKRTGAMGDIIFAIALTFAIGLPEAVIRVLHREATTGSLVNFSWQTLITTMLILAMWISYNRTASILNVRSNVLFALMAFSLVPLLESGLIQFALSVTPKGTADNRVLSMSYLLTLALFFALLFVTNFALARTLASQIDRERARFYARATFWLGFGLFSGGLYVKAMLDSGAEPSTRNAILIFMASILALLIQNGAHNYRRAHTHGPTRSQRRRAKPPKWGF